MNSVMRKAPRILLLGLVLAATGLAVGATPVLAQERGGRWVAQERRDDRRDDRRFEERRNERGEFERHATPWRFERGRGWRAERAPGVWSPYDTSWWVDGRVVLLSAPTTTVVQYPTGQYVLRGDGVSVPYYWIWVPAQAVATMPPPPPVGAPAPNGMAVPVLPPPPPAG